MSDTYRDEAADGSPDIGRLAELERHMANLPSTVRVARALGGLALVSSGVYALTTPAFASDLPLLPALALAVAVAVALLASPTALIRDVPEWASAGLVLLGQSAYTLVTGEADSPYLPGFLAIGVVVAAMSSMATSLVVAGLAGVGLVIVAAADAHLEPVESVSVVMHTLVLFACAAFICHLATLRRREVVRQSTAVGELRQLAETVRHESLHDSLTGVRNRRAFELDLRGAAAGDDARWILVADVDRLKSINDTYGHAGGDAVLRALSGRLVTELRRSDAVYRIGGDEFTAILSAEDARAVAARVGERLHADVEGIGRVSMSIGYADASSFGSSDKLLEAADRRLYEAKAEFAGRSG